MGISTVLLDLDGVVHHFDPSFPLDVEHRHHLQPGVLTAAGYSPDLLGLLITGRMTRAAWEAELKALGIDDRFDAIFNSADIGFAMPDRRAFQYACDHLGVAPPEVFFTDDSEFKLSGAIELGMTARPYNGITRFQHHLDELVRRPVWEEAATVWPSVSPPWWLRRCQ